MTAALGSKDSDTRGREGGAEREAFGGDGGKRVAVETVTIGVQWEEEEEEKGGAVAGAPSSSTRGGLPPWAKPFSRSISPATEAVGHVDHSGSDTGERVTMESSGIQVGESVLGGRMSESALGS